MTEPDPRLQSLADIQEPLLVSDWYLAPIWWLVAGLILLLLGFGLRRLRRRRLQPAAQQLALQELASIDVRQPGSASSITMVLKRYLQSRVPQHPALTTTGEQWQQFLLQTQQQPAAAALPDLLALHYQATPAPEQLQTYADFARHWLQHHQADLIPVVSAAPSPGVCDV